RSHNPVSTTCSFAVPAALTRSGQNDAPDARRRARIASWTSPSGRSADGADPHELACRAELVEHRGPIAVDARGQHVSFEDRRGNRDTLQLLDRLNER